MSFDNERLAVRGRLAEKEQEALRLEMLLDGHRASLRSMLAPFDTLADLPVQEIAVTAVELAARHADYIKVCGEIAARKKYLGLA
jgi:UDP-N-acetylmuramyl pentapeptide synthase